MTAYRSPGYGYGYAFGSLPNHGHHGHGHYDAHGYHGYHGIDGHHCFQLADYRLAEMPLVWAPNAVYYVKPPTATSVRGFVTDAQGVPAPFGSEIIVEWQTRPGNSNRTVADFVSDFISGIATVPKTEHTAIIGNGVDREFTITHGLGTQSVHVEVIETAGDWPSVIANVRRPDPNTVVVSLDASVPPPALDSMRVIVLRGGRPPTVVSPTGTITAASIGLGNVDNTSDASKPISTATQTALNLKANATDIKRFSGLIGNGAALTYDVVHNLGTKDVVVSVRDAVSDVFANAAIRATDINTVTVSLDGTVAPALNSMRVTIVA